MVLSSIIQPERAARIAYQQDFDATMPDLKEVLEVVSSTAWGRSVPRDAYDAELQRIVQQVWIDELIALSTSTGTAPAVRGMATQKLLEIRGWLHENPGLEHNIRTVAHRGFVLDLLDRYVARDYRPGEGAETPRVPPGSPIGTTGRERARDAFLADVPLDWCQTTW